MRQNVTAIGAQHRRFGLPDPTSHALVSSTSCRFLTQDAARREGPPERCAPLLARTAHAALQRSLKAKTHSFLRRFGVITLGFLLCTRPASICHLSGEKIDLSDPSLICLELTMFMYGESSAYLLRSLHVPIAGPNDPIGCLFRALYTAAPNGWTFPGNTGGPVYSTAMNGTVRELSSQINPPPGAKFRPRSLRSGCISAAFSVRVPLPAIMRLSNHHDEKVVHCNYLDALTPPCPESRVFFARFCGVAAPDVAAAVS